MCEWNNVSMCRWNNVTMYQCNNGKVIFIITPAHDHLLPLCSGAGIAGAFSVFGVGRLISTSPTIMPDG